MNIQHFILWHMVDDALRSKDPEIMATLLAKLRDDPDPWLAPLVAQLAEALWALDDDQVGQVTDAH